MFFISVSFKELYIIKIVLLIIFLLQLIFPSVVKRIIIPIILTLQTILMFEYLWNFINIRIISTKFLLSVLEFFTQTANEDGEISTELILVVILYCYYLQYQIYFSNLYLKYDCGGYTFRQYISNKLINHPNLDKFIHRAYFIFQGIYIWGILILIFCCIFLKEINALYSIKLIIFEIIVYKFIHFRKSTRIIIFCWIFIIYCGINTMICYFYQFTTLELVKNTFSDFLVILPSFIQDNLDIIGLKKYDNSDLAKEFLPHYGSNFLSVLLLYEIRRIKYLLENEKKIKKQEKRENLKLFIKGIEDEQDPDNIKFSKLQLNVFRLCKMLTEIYYLFIFFSIFILAANFQVCFSLFTYMFIFVFFFLLMFTNFIRAIKNTEKKFEKQGRKMLFIFRVIKYSYSEKKSHQKYVKTYKNITFKILMIMSFLYILICYCYSFLEMSEKRKEDQDNYSVNLIRSISYMLGTYHSLDRHIILSILPHLLFALFVVIENYMRSLQQYLHIRIERIEYLKRVKKKLILEVAMNEMLSHKNATRSQKSKIKNNYAIKLSMSGLSVSKQSNSSIMDDSSSQHKLKGSPIFEKYQQSKGMIVEKLTEYTPASKVMSKSAADINTKTGFHINFQKANNEDQGFDLPRAKLSMSNVNYKTNAFLIEDDEKDYLRDPIIKKFLNIFSSVSNGPAMYFSKKLRKKNVKLDYIIGLKQVIEELIVLFILLSAISKLNIYSLIYLVLIIVVVIKGINTKVIYTLSIIICSLIFLQYSIFISNLNMNIDTRNTKTIFDILNKTIGVPWYQQLPLFQNQENIKIAFYLSFGTNMYQILKTGFDFFIVVLCFFYLERFSYLIFQENSQTTTYGGKDKVNLIKMKHKKLLGEIFYRIKQDEYDIIKDTLKFNFEIVIPEYSVFTKQLRAPSLSSINTLHNAITLNAKMNKLIKKQNRKTTMVKILSFVKESLYLNLQFLSVILVTILSMMNDGIISLIYLAFSFYYLFNSKKLLLVDKTTFPKKIKKFLLVWLLIDIILQCLYIQIPYSELADSYKYVHIVLYILGYRIAVTDYINFSVDNLTLGLLSVKAVTYFFVSLQILVYSSQDFKEFYSAFLFERRQKTYIYSSMNACLFNNKRMETMKKLTNHRSEIHKVLSNLEEQLKSWENKLSTRYTDPTNEKKKVDVAQEFREEMEKIQNQALEKQDSFCHIEEKDSNIHLIKFREKVREIIMSNLLIKFAFFMNKTSTCYFLTTKEEQDELETALLKGETHIPCLLEKKIVKYLEELDINDYLIMVQDQSQNTEISDKDNEFFLKTKQEDNNSSIYLDNGHEGDITQINEGKDIAIHPVDEINNQIVERLENYDIEKPVNNSNKIEYSYEINEKQLEKNKKFLKSQLFQKYLTKSYLLSFICIKIIQYCAVNFHFACFFFMLLNHIMNADLISLFWPLSIFTYALIEYPRPTKMYWIVSLRYCIIIVVIKFFLQLAALPYIFQAENPEHYTYQDNAYIGIKIFNQPYSAEFLNYIIWDCLVILTILFEQFLLVRYGMWSRVEQEVETIYEAYDRVARTNSAIDGVVRRELDSLINKTKCIHRKKLVIKRKIEINENEEKPPVIVRELSDDEKEIDFAKKKLEEEARKTSFNDRIFPMLRVRLIYYKK
jgi:hypothetical protein